MAIEAPRAFPALHQKSRRRRVIELADGEGVVDAGAQADIDMAIIGVVLPDADALA